MPTLSHTKDTLNKIIYQDIFSFDFIPVNWWSQIYWTSSGQTCYFEIRNFLKASHKL